jgi:small multidrug resistance family-3 protein
MLIRDLAYFVAAAFFELAGCFAFWLWLRRGESFFVAAGGVISLLLFATALTRVDSTFAGRAYAAYGGIYIVGSVLWLWWVEGQRPSTTDLVGACLALVGTLVILGSAGFAAFASKTGRVP